MTPSFLWVRPGLLVLFSTFLLGSVYSSPEAQMLGLPSSAGGQKVLLDRTKFIVLYDNELNNPNWVAQYLTREDVESETIDRKKYSYYADPDIEGEAQTSDYTNSGYDRGHMAPAEDMEISATAMKECFYMTNMVPQRHKLNGGRWQSMEDFARKVAVQKGAAWVFSGPVYRAPNPGECSGTFGTKNVVTVPQAFFKIIVFRSGSTYSTISFLIPHMSDETAVYGPIDSYVASVDEVESSTSFDFLALIEDPLEVGIESRVVTTKELGFSPM